MIENHAVLPAGFHMARSTFTPELRLVNILSLVAIEAGASKRPQHLAAVAGRAVGLLMSALQGKACSRGVIELGRLPSGLRVA